MREQFVEMLREIGCGFCCVRALRKHGKPSDEHSFEVVLRQGAEERGLDQAARINLLNIALWRREVLADVSEVRKLMRRARAPSKMAMNRAATTVAAGPWPSRGRCVRVR